MGTERYAGKRRFDRTPEPAPAAGPPPVSGNRFCVQRHHAGRLHYDLRLEMDGVLKSWAVPKGPTLDPAEKRLAVLVEDHPLEYGGFEGVIPKGNYGAGSVMLWDRGTFQVIGDMAVQGQMQRGDLKFILQGEKLRGAFGLVRLDGRGKGNEWLLLKKKDPFATPGWDAEQYSRSVLTGRSQEEIAQNTAATVSPSLISVAGIPGATAAPMPSALVPMRAHAAATPPEGDEWLYEIKWDGVRVICYVSEGRVRLVSRNGNPCDIQYPEISVLPHRLSAQTAILDGEIAVLDEQGRPSFAALQHRIMASDAHRIAHLARTRPAVLFAFDLVYLDGYDLRQSPLAERKRALEAILKPDGVFRYSQHFAGDGERVLAAARQQGLEGIVAKRAASRYESKRSRDWIKVKTVSQDEFVLCGLTAGEREPFGSIALGQYHGGRLVYTGNVGSGFDETMLAEVDRVLRPLATQHCPFHPAPKLPNPTTWLRPERVASVKFSSWTPDRRLRAPVFQGLRFDVDPKECLRGTSEVQTESVPDPAPPQLLVTGPDSAGLTLDGRRLKFTNLNKVYFPSSGYTKRDLINFYDAVAELVLPHLRGRPLSLKRYPEGIEQEFFFQKDIPKTFPSWLRVEPIVTSPGEEPTRFVVCDDRSTLLYLANLGCIDQNPWMSRAGSLGNPDFILIDLDPVECGFDRIVEAAQLARQKLEALGLESYPKTTGGDGMHLYVPIEARYSYDQARAFAQIIATLLAAERPDLFTTPRKVSKREKGKVYFDWMQIAEGKTISAPYVVRAYQGAPVATPLAWREVVPGLLPARFHLRNALERFAHAGDLFSPVLTKPQPLEPAMKNLEKLVRR
jgi:bifunctional non-homologous end joining protein LigD